MPRVIAQTKSKAGRERSCGKCSRKIEPGETYLRWKFRYGGPRIRCNRPECRPRPSDLTQSKMSEVYAAIESVEDQLPSTEDRESIIGLVQGVAETVREISQEYADAAEPFGNQGENQDRADELDYWADELEGWEPDADEDDEEFDLEDVRTEAEGVLGECPL